MSFILEIWKKCCPPFSNILFKLILPDSLSFGRMSPWVQASLFQLRNPVLLVSRRLCTFEDLQENYNLPKHMFYFYLQVKHLFRSLSSALTQIPTIFEYICTKDSYQCHLISSLYKVLHETSRLLKETLVYAQVGTCPSEAYSITPLGQDLNLCL